MRSRHSASHLSQAAETLALQALAWIMAEPERSSALMVNTGLSPEALKLQILNPDFLGGILDYLLSDETQVLAFCAEMAIPPETPARLRAALPGGGIE